MPRFIRIVVQVFAVVGVVGAAVAAATGQPASAVDSTRKADQGQVSSPANGVQLAFHENAQTANLPVGTIRLRVIDRVGGPTLSLPIKWRIETYGRDSSGQRHLAAELAGAAPEVDLPAAWYIVYAELPDQTIKHPIEVTAGRTFKYTLVKK